MPLPSTLARFSSWRRAGIRVGLRVGFRLGLGLAATLAVAAGLPSPALAQQAAHTHGRLDLAVALDATAITIRLESPLDNFLGFERAPRTDDERRRVADLAARLRAADQWLRPDPAARCRLARVDLDSAVPGLGKGTATNTTTTTITVTTTNTIRTTTTIMIMIMITVTVMNLAMTPATAPSMRLMPTRRSMPIST